MENSMFALFFVLWYNLDRRLKVRIYKAGGIDMLVLMGGMLLLIIAVVVVSVITSVVSAVAASEDIDS